MSRIDTYLSDEAALLQRLARAPIEQLAALLRRARTEGRTIFIFGNGGSAASASHLVTDLTKGTLAPDRPRFKIICLSDNTPTLTAVANDLGYEHVFALPLESLAEPGDIALAISGSGNSPNVLLALQAARRLGLTTVGLSGTSGGKLKDLVDLAILVPSPSMQLIEDTHVVILHSVFVELCAE
jgi:D-sedoheptulose 7-phosphate isomerase